MEMNTKKLDELIKLLAEEKHVARIGVLGQGNAKNAQVGAVAEYGTTKIAQRSFLRMPLNEQLFKYVSKTELVKEEFLEEIVQKRSMLMWFKKLASIAERVVLDAFATAGFGKWAAWKDPNYKNNTGMILIDTQQLRDSITTRID